MQVAELSHENFKSGRVMRWSFSQLSSRLGAKSTREGNLSDSQVYLPPIQHSTALGHTSHSHCFKWAVDCCLVPLQLQHIDSTDDRRTKVPTSHDPVSIWIRPDAKIVGSGAPLYIGLPYTMCWSVEKCFRKHTVLKHCDMSSLIMPTEKMTATKHKVH